MTDDMREAFLLDDAIFCLFVCLGGDDDKDDGDEGDVHERTRV